MQVDNGAVSIIINTGRSRDPKLQDCLRELAFTAAMGEFQIKAVHILGRDNRILDLLSRWGRRCPSKTTVQADDPGKTLDQKIST